MKWLFRYLQWFILCWGLVILIIFKVINNFVFKNNSSLLFVFLLFGVPIMLIVIKRLLTKHHKKNYIVEKTTFYEQLLMTVKKALFEKLNVKNKHYDSETKTLTFSECGMLVYHPTFALLTIVGTDVKYYFHYGKNLVEMRKYDIYGLEKRPVLYCHQRILERINTLLSYQQLLYHEYQKGKILVGCELIGDGEVIYLTKDKDSRKLKAKKMVEKEVVL